MNELFNRVPQTNVAKSDFDLSHEKKLTCGMGRLIPVLYQEVVPGDMFNIRTEHVVKLPTLLSPLMHRINVHINYFFVPNRIIWNDWEDFITRKDTDLVLPGIDYGDVNTAEASLADYFGLPLGNMASAAEQLINTMPVRAYWKIYDQFYRDPDIQSELFDSYCDEEADSNPGTNMITSLESKCICRNWENDYFTSSRPWAQKGTMATAAAQIDTSIPWEAGFTDGTRPTSGSGVVTDSDGDTTTRYLNISADGSAKNVYFDGGIEVSIDEIRYAESLQQMMEKLAKTGSRYKDWLRGFFGVDNQDSRLDMVEYLGGTKDPVTISEVVANAQSLDSTDTVDQALGSRAGLALSVGVKQIVKANITEHGFIMGILSIIPEPNYHQGLHRMWSRQTDLDFLLPEFAQLGEQEVYNKEIYFTNDGDTTDNDVFGYAPRYQEYRFMPNTVHGEFRDTLMYWTLVRDFDSCPDLNATFLRTNPADYSDIFAVSSLVEEQAYVMLYHQIYAKRPLPYYVTAHIG